MLFFNKYNCKLILNAHSKNFAYNPVLNRIIKLNEKQNLNSIRKDFYFQRSNKEDIHNLGPRNNRNYLLIFRHSFEKNIGSF